MAIVKVTSEISFNTVYAEYQHEHIELHHPRGGHAKFLEAAIKQYSGLFEEYVGVRVKKAVDEAREANSAEDVAKIIADETEDAVGAFAEIVGGAAASGAPIDEGTLRGSLEVYTERMHELG